MCVSGQGTIDQTIRISVLFVLFYCCVNESNLCHDYMLFFVRKKNKIIIIGLIIIRILTLCAVIFTMRRISVSAYIALYIWQLYQYVT